jgi:chemotaxis protein methyltransferase CheR
MFRDAAFYGALREHVLPVLRTYSAFKIWHAGCSTGEEVYSLAIMLTEAGLYERAVIYATDVNPLAIKQAQEGIYPLDDVKRHTAGYQRAGGCESFATYYSAAYGGARFDPELRRNVVFAGHNLTTDDVFSEVHVILCRNVFIYFKKDLQARVLKLFTRSLRYKGFLCLGDKETVKLLPGGNSYEEIPASSRIFRKIARDPEPLSGGHA